MTVLHQQKEQEDEKDATLIWEMFFIVVDTYPFGEGA